MSRTTERPALPLPGGLSISRDEVIADYRLGFQSRVASVIGRREVLTGKAKFGIFGDGKEVPQLAMAKVFQPGDWRSGYYRDQTFMLAAEILTLHEFFGQLYADTDLANDPASGGRQMGSHFATRYLDSEYRFLPQLDRKHSAADLSPTAGQMTKLLGLAYASKLYRENEGLKDSGKDFSNNGNEVAFGTIGNASTSEGVFWETVNAAGVLQVPLVLSIWDDGYGISVPNEFQTTKGSISAVLRGFQKGEDGKGFDIFVVKGWDYAALCDAYVRATAKARSEHVPAIIHVTELTQPQGHSTSGSHERYKSEQRLQWETEFDCLKKMRELIIENEWATDEQISEWEDQERRHVEAERKASWDRYMAPIQAEQEEALALLEGLGASVSADLRDLIEGLRSPAELNRKLIASRLVQALTVTVSEPGPAREKVRDFLERYKAANTRRYSSHLYSESSESPLNVEGKKPTYSEASEAVDGRLVLTKCFDHNFKKDARLFVVGEDVGKLGDVNLVFEGLNSKYGDLRVTDTGIREMTIFGQGIGTAMRGLRPIVDIQYLDYFLYALQGVSDDLATLHFRTAGGQKAPVIIRTKGHRLQGIWHTGSPMAVILHSCRGVYLCVPRDMTQAAGMYNTLFRSDNPAIVIEVLSGYRLKERVPDNVGTFTVPLGVPEVIREGTDLTIVTYGACCRIALEAANDLETAGVQAEIIDVQTLNPFDVGHTIVSSVEKTNAVIFLDEDVPGGASAYMMREVLERQEGWQWLDAPPRTLSAIDGRSAYATDGDYFSKPSREDVFLTAYALMNERNPRKFPSL